MTEELTVDVPLEPIGEAPAVSLHGGTLQALDHVRVKALPDRLPQFLEIPIDQLADFDAVLHVRDLTVPSDVTLLTDPDEILAKVLPPRIEEVEVPAEAEEAAEAVEAAEAAEGEAAPAEAAGPEGEGSTEG
jgi:large subunit ribosomal protein L25